ncbi:MULTISPECIES: energy transducer TonB [Acidithiobacillus]|jgi:TonB family protein|nr:MULTISPECIES: energy transducer TonB [Acidithiobacillus]MCL5956944.1 energy transducer TonB [Gammaproteobacteria bacterium]MCR0969396.1 energy transducer TonB [Acidithiobacillus ferrooxidans]MCR1343733.1 energy transducer TonB [Acidithiobacillus ferrooxidans]MCR1346131.1 energy transducer TonB [Acidithiobacillus ferrooxidans]MCR1349280.1 energy transducer TonB [Acidithiobacillus ferrooxidans]
MPRRRLRERALNMLERFGVVFSRDRLTLWLIGAAACVASLTFLIYRTIRHEVTRTVAAPSAFRMVRMPPSPPAPVATVPPAKMAPVDLHGKASRPLSGGPSARQAGTHPAKHGLPKPPPSRPVASPAMTHAAYLPPAWTVSTPHKANLISRYVTYWIRQVESTGAREGPIERGGEIQVRVTVFRNGNLAQLSVVRSTLPASASSKAVRMIRTASPFAPFPEDLARQANKLVIRCTMNFLNGDVGAQSRPSASGGAGIMPTQGLSGSLSQALLGSDS